MSNTSGCFLFQDAINNAIDLPQVCMQSGCFSGLGRKFRVLPGGKKENRVMNPQSSPFKILIAVQLHTKPCKS